MIDVIKEVVERLLDRKKMTKLEFGVVETIAPLTVRIDSKKLLQEEDLILSHLVKDYYADVTVQHSTDSIYGSWDTGHDHPDAGKNVIPTEHEHEYKGRKKILVHNGLLVGEKVAMIRQEGGQVYYVIDRINDPAVQGEWI